MRRVNFFVHIEKSSDVKIKKKRIRGDINGLAGMLDGRKPKKKPFL